MPEGLENGLSGNGYVEEVEEVEEIAEEINDLNKIDEIDSILEETSQNGLTSEHQRIIDFASAFDISDVSEWSTLDIIKWKTYGGDEYLQSFENEWIEGYSDVINAAA